MFRFDVCVRVATNPLTTKLLKFLLPVMFVSGFGPLAMLDRTEKLGLGVMTMCRGCGDDEMAKSCSWVLSGTGAVRWGAYAM